MSRMIRSVLRCAVLGAVLLPSVVVGQDAALVTKVIVVRHAEKAGASGDVPLNEIGKKRAELLAKMVAAEVVTGLISTPFQRTQQTLAPIAAQAGVVIELAEITGGMAAHVEDIANRIRSRYRGGTIVVAGHSNTVPAIVEALGGGEVPMLTDDDYDDLYVVTLHHDGSASLLHLKYGVDLGG